MPFVDNKGMSIYYEVEGKGPPVAMVLGMSTSLETWRSEGVVASLGKAYRLIMIDARSNGKSAKPHDPAAYTAEAMVGDVLAVLDKLGVDHTHYWGYSMGASLGYHCFRLAPQRFASLILGGTSPLGMRKEDEQQFAEMGLRSLAMAAEMGMEDYATFFEQNSGPMKPAERASFVANDPKAVLAMVTGMTAWPTMGDMLPSLVMPCLIYMGELDIMLASAREAAQRMPNARFVVVPGAHHFNIRGEQVISTVERFLAEVVGG